MAFFAKNGHFSIFDRTTALCPTRIEVCWAFLQKKVSKLIFLRDFFSIFVIFLPLLAAGPVDPLLAHFGQVPPPLHFGAPEALWGSKMGPKWSKSRIFSDFQFRLELH